MSKGKKSRPVTPGPSDSFMLVEWFWHETRVRTLHSFHATLRELDAAARSRRQTMAAHLSRYGCLVPAPIYPKQVGARRHELQAFTLGGKAIHVDDLLVWHDRTRKPTNSYGARHRAPIPGYVRRASGPVPGIHSSRSYSASWLRRPRTMAERRANSAQRRLEEPAARPARTGYNLVDSRDDLARCHVRCWKAQHRGRKAWDR